MANYIFLDDGRRVDVTHGHVRVFPDDGFDFRGSNAVGSIERRGTIWMLSRNGRHVGEARSRKEAVMMLLADAADDLATREREERAELKLFDGAVLAVQRLLPGFQASGTFGPFLVFSPQQALDLIAAAADAEPDEEELPEDDDIDGAPPYELLRQLAQQHLGVTYEDDPSAIIRLATIGITNGAWRNTHLESLHAGDHPSGGFPDTDMMRFNLATTRTVGTFVGDTGADWAGLTDELTNPDRVLPGGRTVGVLAGEEFGELADDVERALEACALIEQHSGAAYALTQFALHGGMACKHWYGTPWWPDVVAAFIEAIQDPASAAWRYDDRGAQEPSSVVDRDHLRASLRETPEHLDDDALRWCLQHGLSDFATHLGYARWRKRRDTGWVDPMPWLTE